MLGVSPLGHDTSAALVVDGDLIAACEQERYSKDKHSRLFPKDAITDCLNIAGMDIGDVDMIAIPWSPEEAVRDFFLGNALKSHDRLRNLYENRFSPVLEFLDLEQTIRSKLSYTGPVKFFKHHLCHISSTYHTSGFDDALCLSIDGLGESESTMIGIASKGEITKVIAGEKYPNSLGLAYAAVTEFLGWKHACDEGIIMGLACFGNSSEFIPCKEITYLDFFRESLVTDGHGHFSNRLPEYFDYFDKRNVWIGPKFSEFFGDRRHPESEVTDHHKNIAAGMQDRLVEIVIEKLRNLQLEFDMPRLCLAGGVALNCSMNGEIEREGIFDEIFVVPAAGDAGVSVGAAFEGFKQISGSRLSCLPRHNFYLGYRITNDAAKTTAKARGYEPTETGALTVSEFAAARLAEGMVIGVANDGAEFGPRALGNRSILADPRTDKMRDFINARVKFREGFRPFAPAVLIERELDYFEMNYSSPHMLRGISVKENAKQLIPAVVHVDDSARVQSVSKELNPKFWQLISDFSSITGVPVLLNTSLNVKGQPVVNDEEDAFDALETMNLDFMIIGGMIFGKKNV